MELLLDAWGHRNGCGCRESLSVQERARSLRQAPPVCQGIRVYSASLESKVYCSALSSTSYSRLAFFCRSAQDAVMPLTTEAQTGVAVTPLTKADTSGRVASVDALRGFDMFWIIGADALFYALNKLAG